MSIPHEYTNVAHDLLTIDATPNDGYVLRILNAYLEKLKPFYDDNVWTGSYADQDRRLFLRRAIRILEKADDIFESVEVLQELLNDNKLKSTKPRWKVMIAD